MKIPNFKGGNIYKYIIAFADNGAIIINVDQSGDIINYDVDYSGKLVKNYTDVYTGIPDNEVQTDIYKATGGVFEWKKIDDGLMLGGSPNKHGYHYEIKSNLTGTEVIYNNLPIVEVVAKKPPKMTIKDFLNKKIVGLPLWVVALGLLGWFLIAKDPGKLRRK